MADLVISDADLEMLRGALRLVLTDLEGLRKSVSATDEAPVGAAPLIAAQTRFAEARRQDIEALGTSSVVLADKVDEVSSTMKATDLKLGSQAERAV